jgi:hypothetical protein
MCNFWEKLQEILYGTFPALKNFGHYGCLRLATPYKINLVCDVAKRIGWLCPLHISRARSMENPWNDKRHLAEEMPMYSKEIFRWRVFVIAVPY